MARSDWRVGGYCRSSFNVEGESEASGCSGQIDTELAASEHSSAPTRKFVNVGVYNCGAFGVPMQVFSEPSYLSSSERKDLINKFRLELEQIRKLQNKVELQTPKVAALSNGSDILSCKKRKDGPRDSNFRKTSATSSVFGKKMHPSGPSQLNKDTFEKFEARKQVSVPSCTNVMLMKQCDALLKRLMSHQHGWIFNTPVDIVKLNIPDYFTIIKHPMDLGTVKKKLVSGAYSSPLEFLADVRLTFRNAMEYNPKGDDVHIMADTLSKYFEVRWKAIEKKLPKPDSPALPIHTEFCPPKEMEPTNILPVKRRKITSDQQQVDVEPVKRVMAMEEKQKLCSDLESLIGEIPPHVIDFIKMHSSGGGDDREDEIEIDINELADDTIFALRKLLDDYVEEKKNRNQARVEPCEIELLNESGPSNSSIHLQKGDEIGDDEDIDIGGNELPVTSFPSVEIEKDMDHEMNTRYGQEKGTCSEDEWITHSSGLTSSPKVDHMHSETKTPNPPGKSGANSSLQEQISQRNLIDVPVGKKPDEDSAQSQKQLLPDKQYRVALLKNRFADIILKAQEKTLLPNPGRNDDPEKLKREREQLELRKRKEKARLQAEARAAEAARRQAEEVAAQEAKKKRELEREAARQELLKIEKTVTINENSQLLEELEMFRGGPVDHILTSADEDSPYHYQDGLGGFDLGGRNPLEKLGLFMKEDDEEEEIDSCNVLKPDTDVEEGEID